VERVGRQGVRSTTAALAHLPGSALLAFVLLAFALLVAGCARAVEGTAQPADSTASSPVPARPSSARPVPSAVVAAPRQADAVPPCSVATQQQVLDSFGALAGVPTSTGRGGSGCVWPLASGPGDGFLVGYGRSYAEVVGEHPAATGAFAADSDGNSTWLWCERADTHVYCGAAVAIGAERTFVTGLVRTQGPAVSRSSVLGDLEALTVPLLRTLPAG